MGYTGRLRPRGGPFFRLQVCKKVGISRAEVSERVGKSVIQVFKRAENNNFLLTEREGRTGEYWPEVVAVRTERSEVRTKTTEGQYSSVRSRASEVSK